MALVKDPSTRNRARGDGKNTESRMTEGEAAQFRPPSLGNPTTCPILLENSDA